MFKSMPTSVEALLVTLGACALLAVIATSDCDAQDVSYCKNYETGEIIVVEAGMPCPYPTVQL